MARVTRRRELVRLNSAPNATTLYQYFIDDVPTVSFPIHAQPHVDEAPRSRRALNT